MIINNIHKLIKSLALVFIITSMMNACTEKTQRPSMVALLCDTAEMENKEIMLAFDYLTKLMPEKKCMLLSPDSLIKEGVIPESIAMIWIHRSDTTALPESMLKADFLEGIKKWTLKGGKLLLSQEAFCLLHPLGLENRQADLHRVDAVDHGYGRRLGMHAYLSHPLFDGLNNGAYIFNPAEDCRTRLRGYMGRDMINGKVAAIDWSYITFHEDRRLITEYKTGKGSVLAIGAYVLFNIENNNKEIFDSFMQNAFSYLLEGSSEKAFFWKNQLTDVSPTNHQGPRLKRPASQIWKTEKSSLHFSFLPESSEFWDLGGERMMITGREAEGIDEIWAHPFMALQDYHIKILSPEGRLLDPSGMHTNIHIEPAFIERIYSNNDIMLKELICLDHDKPVAIIHYEFEGPEAYSLMVSFSSRQRLMWPYSHEAIGGLKYCFDENSHAFFISDKEEAFVSYIGCSLAALDIIAGQYDSIIYNKGKLSGHHSESLIVSCGALYPAKEAMDIVIAASHYADPYAADYYAEAFQNPQEILKNTKEYYDTFFDEKLLISSPEREFNEAYRWALFGTDRHFFNTPGIGSSMVAGIGNTVKGWWGGHEVNGRPGYAWYFGRDAEWSAFAMLDYGDYKKVKEVLSILIKYQHPSGKIFHELTTSGAVHYDAADATPLFIVLAGKYLRASGDSSFIRQVYPSIKKAMDFCYSTDTDKDGFIENTNVGHGWVEGGFLFGGKTTIYLASCWTEALSEAAYIANYFGKGKEYERYYKDYQSLLKKTNHIFYNNKKGYYMHSLMADGSFIEERTIMPCIPMYFEQLNESHVRGMLMDYASNNFTSGWGCRIVGSNSPHFSPRGYHTGSVWPLYTGWVALAEYNYGRPLQGYMHVRSTLGIYKHWAKGFIEEVLHGGLYRPNGVCAHQCWSETMALQPLIEGMLGLRTDAINNSMKLMPAFPAGWDSCRVENISIGDKKIDFSMRREKNIIHYDFNSNQGKKITVFFEPQLPQGSKAVIINETGEKQSLPLVFSMGLKHEIYLSIEGGIALLPPLSKPEPGDSANGLRVINDSLKDNIYTISLEAPSGYTADLRLYSLWDGLETINEQLTAAQGNFYDFKVQFNKGNGLQKKDVTFRVK